MHFTSNREASHASPADIRFQHRGQGYRNPEDLLGRSQARELLKESADHVLSIRDPDCQIRGDFSSDTLNP